MGEEFRVAVGRYNPMHLGHEKIFESMLQGAGNNGCLAIIGSSNAGFSLRHYFSYEERRRFIKMIFSDLKIVGLPDYPTDQEWLMALDDILRAMGVKPEQVVFSAAARKI